MIMLAFGGMAVAPTGCGGGGSGDGDDSAGLELPAGPTCDLPSTTHTLVEGALCSQVLTVDDARVYFQSPGALAPDLYARAKCGDAPAEVVQVRTPFTDLAWVGPQLWGVSQGAVLYIPLDGSSAVPLVTGLRDAKTLASDGDALIVASHLSCLGGSCSPEEPIMWRVPLVDATPVPVIMATFGQIDDIAVVDDWIWFYGDLEASGRHLHRVRRDGTGLEALPVTSYSNVVRLAVDRAASAIFVPENADILEFDADSGESRVFATMPEANDRPVVVAVDARWVYASTALGRFFRWPRTGGQPEMLLPDSRMGAVTVDQGAVYAIDCNTSLLLVWASAP